MLGPHGKEDGIFFPDIIFSYLSTVNHGHKVPKP